MTTKAKQKTGEKVWKNRAHFIQVKVQKRVNENVSRRISRNLSVK